MIQIRFPDDYGYWWDIIDTIMKGKKLPLDEIHLVGGRKSGKSSTVHLAMAFLALFCPYVGLIAWRFQQQDKDELISDFENIYDSYEIPYTTNHKKGLLKFKNNNIRVCGINNNRKGQKAQKSGLAKFGNVKYIFIFLEERFEFSESSVRSIKEAVRSVNPDLVDVQYIFVCACNPWAKGSPYIQFCSLHQSWNVALLKETGSQIGIYDIPLPEEGTKRILFHYTNWRANKQFLPKGDIKEILDTWNYDKRRAATVDWGLPGYEEGAIYTHLLNNIGKAIYQEHEILFGGGDYGWGTDNVSGKTVFHFGGYTSNDAIDIYNEYVQCNHEIAKDPNRVAREVIQFYATSMQEYTSRIGWASPFNMTVRVDNMAVGFIQILNNTAQSMRCNWIRFIKCRKFPIQDRISITQSQMGKQKLRLSEKVVLLKQEFEMSYYEQSTTQKRAKVNDHAINAFEYGIEPFMYQLARENGLTEIAFRKARLN